MKFLDQFSEATIWIPRLQQQSIIARLHVNERELRKMMTLRKSRKVINEKKETAEDGKW